MIDTHIDIDAPAEHVWRELMAFDAYKDWVRAFRRRITCYIQPTSIIPD